MVPSMPTSTRLLAAFGIAVHLLAISTPCATPFNEEVRVESAGEHARHENHVKHSNHAAHAARGSTSESADLALSAPCPCGCDDRSGGIGISGVLGDAVFVRATDLAEQLSAKRLVTRLMRSLDGVARSFDHVPISSLLV